MANGPITWRNISPTVSPGNANSASSPIAESMATGLEFFRDLSTEYREQDQRNWETLRDKQTNDFLGLLAQERDGQAYSDKRDEGYFQSVLDSYGEDIDRKAAREALDSRGDTLRLRDQNKRIAADQLADVENRGIRSELAQLASRGPGAGFNARFQEVEDQLVDAAGIFRQGVQSQRAHSSEQRSQAGEQRDIASAGRAAERHARQGILFDQNQAAYLEGEKKKQELSDIRNTVMEFSKGQDANKVAIEQATNQTALDVGMPLTEDGAIDYTNASDESLAAFNERLENMGLAEGTQNQTQSTQALASLLYGQYDLTKQEATSYAQTHLEGRDASVGLTAEQETQLNQQMQIVESKQQQLLDSAQQELQSVQKNNPFVRKDDAVDTLEDVVTEFQKTEVGEKFLSATNSNQGAFERAVFDVALEGVQADDGTTVRLSAPIMQGLISQYTGQWRAGNLPRDIKSGLQELVRQNTDKIIEAENAEVEHSKKVDEVNRNTMRLNAEMRARMRRDSGVEETPNHYRNAQAELKRRLQ